MFCDKHGTPDGSILCRACDLETDVLKLTEVETLEDHLVVPHVFYLYPQLMDIWPEPFRATMIEATMESVYNHEKGLYLIWMDDKVVGMTGFFYVPEQTDLKEPFLRWTGLVPEYRLNGLFRQAMRLLEQQLPAEAEGLTELIPVCDYGAALVPKFEALGFERTGYQEQYDWSEYMWQPYRKALAVQKVAKATPAPVYDRGLLELAEQCGATITGQPDGSEAIKVVFSIEAWRKFDLAQRDRERRHAAQPWLD